MTSTIELPPQIASRRTSIAKKSWSFLLALLLLSVAIGFFWQSNAWATTESGSTSTTYVYDEKNRLIEVSYANGSWINYEYDAADNRVIKEVPEPDGTPMIVVGALLLLWLVRRRPRKLKKARQVNFGRLVSYGLPIFLLLFAVKVHASDTQPAFTIVDLEEAFEAQSAEAAGSSAVASSQAAGCCSDSPLDGVDTQELTDLAKGFLIDGQNGINPRILVEHLRANVAFSPTWGSEKGPMGALLDREANDFDQTSLTLALLDAASPPSCKGRGRYVYGLVRYTGEEISQWLGVPDNAYKLRRLLIEGGRHPDRTQVVTNANGSLSYIDMERIWPAQENVSGCQEDNGADIPDPAVSIGEPIAGLDLDTILGEDMASNILASALAGATVNTNYIQGLNQEALEAALEAYSMNLADHLRQNFPDATQHDLLGGIQRYQDQYTPGSAELPRIGTVQEVYASWSPSDSAVQALRTTLRIEYRGIDVTVYADQLPGKRLTLFDNSGVPTLYLDGQVLGTGQAYHLGGSTVMNLSVKHPHPTSVSDQSRSVALKAGGAYTMVAGFGRSGYGRVTHHEKRNQANAHANSDASAEPVLGETMQVLASRWLYEVSESARIAGKLIRGELIPHHTVGVVGQNNSPYIDVPMGMQSLVSWDNDSAEKIALFQAAAGVASAHEGGLFEQTMGVKGLSTVELLGLANDQNLRLYAATSTNFSSVVSPAIISSYSSADYAIIQQAVNNGKLVLLPESGTLTIDQWTGAGYLTLTEGSAGYQISGNLKGGYSSQWLDNSLLNSLALPPMDFTPPSFPPVVAGDPINMATGDFVLDETDIGIGSQPFPLGLAFSRSYNSAARYNDSEMGAGWKHGFHLSATTLSDSVEGRGVHSAIAGAAAIVASRTALDLHTGPMSAEKILTASLIQRWAKDQLVDNLVNIEAPGKSQLFSKLPDNSYQPIGASADHLAEKTNGGYTLESASGSQIDFQPGGLIERWSDPNGNVVDFNYSGDNLTRVSNSVGHELALTYSNGLVSSVSDGTRSFQYGYDNEGNLTEVTDANGHVTRYDYGEGHGLLTQVFGPAHPNDPDVTNWYDSFGRVHSQENALGSRFEYHYTGNRTEEIDINGDSTIWYFDDRGQSLREIDAGSETTSEYDGLSRLVARTSPSGNQTTYEYDALHNLIQVRVQPKPGSSTAAIEKSFTYGGPFNRRLSQTEPNGAVTEYEYDNRGNLIETRWPAVAAGNGIATIEYNHRGQPTLTRDAGGWETQLEYDEYANLTRTVAGVGSINAETLFTYDSAGNQTSQTDAQGRTITTDYDLMRRPVEITSPAPENYRTILHYDEEGRVIQTDQETGIASQPWVRDFASFTVSGQPSTTTDAEYETTLREYDGLDRLSRVTDAEGQTTEYLYNPRGQVWKMIDAAGVVTAESEYTASGQISTLRDAKGNLTSYLYDEFDRLARTVYADGTEELRTYNEAGTLASFTNRSGQGRHYEYDSRNQLVQKSVPYGGDYIYEYDIMGRLTAYRDTDGWTQIDRSPRGEILRTVDPDGHEVSSEYDVLGNRVRLTYPDGYAVEYRYNTQGQLSRIEGPDGSALAEYSHDGLGRTSAVQFGNGSSTAIQSNPDSSIASILHQFSGGEAVSFDYSYNAINQRVADDISDSRFQYRPPLSQSTTTTANELNQFNEVGGRTMSYDQNGNLFWDGTSTFIHDEQNQLIYSANETSSASYVYSAFGQRRLKSSGLTTTRYVHDGEHVIAEYEDGPDGALLKRFVYGPGIDRPVSMTIGQQEYYYHLDALGSVVALSDGTGALAEAYAYSPFGEVSAPSQLGNPFLYTARAMDPETGLYYYRNRYYDAALGRFLQPDPSGYQGGINLYAYVEANPLNLVDPFGLRGQSSWGSGLDSFQNGLDMASLAMDASVAGSAFSWVPDIANAGISLARGDYLGAGLSAAAALPFVGAAANVARLGRGVTNGTTVIGRVKDLKNLKPGERSLLDRLPDKGNPKENWKQNSGVLRQEMGRRKPIRDASPGDTSGQFLNAERNLLKDRGWSFDYKTNYWNPPKQ